jgi:hypothetical protein
MKSTIFWDITDYTAFYIPKEYTGLKLFVCSPIIPTLFISPPTCTEIGQRVMARIHINTGGKGVRHEDESC